VLAITVPSVGVTFSDPVGIAIMGNGKTMLVVNTGKLYSLQLPVSEAVGLVKPSQSTGFLIR
jgi:hypothetical protein